MMWLRVVCGVVVFDVEDSLLLLLMMSKRRRLAESRHNSWGSISKQ
jgi:hypothetical protein